MARDKEALIQALDALGKSSALSGVAAVYSSGDLVAGRAVGEADRTHGVLNTLETRFQTASGCKIFAAVAICRLVEEGRLTFETRLQDCVDVEFPKFDPSVTVHHLLTHTSGVPDYFDEEEGGDYEALWKKRPCYAMNGPRDFLPMFREKPMKSTPGAGFCYSNAGFILLGLIVEHVTGEPFNRYVERNVLGPAGMIRSGYFRLDGLPQGAAAAYIESGGTWRTNVYSVPAVGGPDGGAFVTAQDMMRFWTALHDGRLLGPSMTTTLLQPHVEASGGSAAHYGYGVWIGEDPVGRRFHYVEGWDPGVAFLSAFYRQRALVVTIARNDGGPVWKIFREIAPLLDGS